MSTILYSFGLGVSHTDLVLPAAVFLDRQSFKQALASATVFCSRAVFPLVTPTTTHLGTLVRSVPPTLTFRVVTSVFDVDVMRSVWVVKGGLYAYESRIRKQMFFSVK